MVMQDKDIDDSHTGFQQNGSAITLKSGKLLYQYFIEMSLAVNYTMHANIFLTGRQVHNLMESYGHLLLMTNDKAPQQL